MRIFEGGDELMYGMGDVFMGEDSGLGETVNPLADFEENPSVGGDKIA